MAGETTLLIDARPWAPEAKWWPSLLRRGEGLMTFVCFHLCELEADRMG